MPFTNLKPIGTNVKFNFQVTTSTDGSEILVVYNCLSQGKIRGRTWVFLAVPKMFDLFPNLERTATQPCTHSSYTLRCKTKKLIGKLAVALPKFRSSSVESLLETRKWWASHVNPPDSTQCIGTLHMLLSSNICGLKATYVVHTNQDEASDQIERQTRQP